METAKILIVDDESSIGTLLCTSLSQQGYSCSVCTRGDEALAAMDREPSDLVILDMQMPGMSGIEVLRKARGKYPRTAFLMATGVNDVQVAVEAMKQGASEYLVKPFQLDAVYRAVERALEKRRLELEVEDYRLRLEEMVEQRTAQLHAALRRIELTYDETLEALAAALDLRDNETAGHSRRVTRYCLLIGQAMGCTPDEMKQIERGAYLHDIGKIGIPDSILMKPGKLTLEEQEMMHTHVRIGYDLVCRIAFLAGAAGIVLTHQERFDGTGYPQGLMGEEIPLGARIFAVADTLDAMTSDRPYRRALTFAAANEEILRESGRQFDPKVVEAFGSVPASTWEEVRLKVSRNHVWQKPPVYLAAAESARAEQQTRIRRTAGSRR